ncbi:cache domain-containing protein [Nocardioides speluncae]|uniref:cache domain-containing protein n=1 Tax=Nocardioides speluncae TaxID=2670337 RepID=UPI001F0B985C|nr:cache domain-containing protein [Nocardioides speluncae]
MRTATTGLEVAADEVTRFFERLFTSIELMQRAVQQRFAAGPVDTRGICDAVRPDVHALLSEGVVLGCGFVADRDALTDCSLYLAWWQGESQQLLGQADAPAGDPFDYTLREWFRVPLRTGQRHITGPYVDYVCTDEYVVTCTMPVIAGGRMVGVVGADTLAERMEEFLGDALRSADATLISDHGRVVVSADPQCAAGTLIEAPADRVPCGDLPLAVCLAHPA